MNKNDIIKSVENKFTLKKKKHEAHNNSKQKYIKKWTQILWKSQQKRVRNRGEIRYRD